MEDREKALLKEKLIEQLAQTKESVESLKTQSKPVAPENAIGRLTRMEAINSKSISDEALRLAETKLMKLQRALRRIDDDPEFGFCEDCGQRIMLKRLELMPEVTLCVNCAD